MGDITVNRILLDGTLTITGTAARDLVITRRLDDARSRGGDAIRGVVQRSSNDATAGSI